jgi:hypothetical protein
MFKTTALSSVCVEMKMQKKTAIRLLGGQGGVYGGHAEMVAI